MCPRQNPLVHFGCYRYDKRTQQLEEAHAANMQALHGDEDARTKEKIQEMKLRVESEAANTLGSPRMPPPSAVRGNGTSSSMASTGGGGGSVAYSSTALSSPRSHVSPVTISRAMTPGPHLCASPRQPQGSAAKIWK